MRRPQRLWWLLEWILLSPLPGCKMARSLCTNNHLGSAINIHQYIHVLIIIGILALPPCDSMCFSIASLVLVCLVLWVTWATSNLTSSQCHRFYCRHSLKITILDIIALSFLFRVMHLMTSLTPLSMCLLMICTIMFHLFRAMHPIL